MNLHKKKVLFCEVGVYGGSVKRLINLLGNLEMSDYEPAVLSFFCVNKALDLKKVINEKSPFFTLGLSKFPAPDVLRNYFFIPFFTLFGLKYFLKSLRVIALFRPDLIYLNNTPYSHTPVILSAKIFKIPFVCHMRDSIQLTKIERWALNNAERIVVLSETHKKYYHKQGVPLAKMSVVYNGIDILQFDIESKKEMEHPVECNDKSLVLVGSLSSRKRQFDAINVVGQLKNSYPDINILFLGDGPERENLEKLVRDNSLENNVFFIGEVANVAPYLPKCKIADREGMPNVILEYMAAGLPVIATDLPGVSEMVKEGETGCIVPVGDVEVIISSINNILASSELCENMGIRARKVLMSGKFTVKNELESLENLISNV